jgi:hypothetical protein
MACEFNAFISRLMFKLKRPTSPRTTGWSLYFLPLLSEFHLPGTEPADKKDVCNNALNVLIVASIIANMCSWILQCNDL